MAAERDISLQGAVRAFASADDQVAIGDLRIRRDFARNVMVLFAASNAFVLVGLGVVFAFDCAQLPAKQITPAQRIIDSRVVMTLLGATTVQLGTVVFTIARAVFPTATDHRRPRRLRESPRRRGPEGSRRGDGGDAEGG